MGFLRTLREYRMSHGTAHTLRRGAEKAVQRVLGTYDRRRKAELPDAAELARQRANPPEGGVISVLIPVYNTDPGMLGALLDSLREQTYGAWEAVLLDGGSTRAETREALRRAAREEPRFRVIRREENLGISGNTNAALAQARGGYCALCDHDDLLSPEALWRAAEAIARDRPDVIYSDEDRVTESGRHYLDPFWKPDFCPVDLVSSNYLCHLSVIRTGLLREIGGLRPGFDGSQDHDLFLRACGRAEKIVHLPRTLYSWRLVKSSMSHRNLEQCLTSACRAVAEYETAHGRPVDAVPVNREIRLWYRTDPRATVEALIWGESETSCRQGLAELRRCTGIPDFPAALLVPEEGGLFRALNEAAASSGADFLLVMDARLRNMNRHFLSELQMYAQREDVCCASPTLHDRKKRITHGGFVLGTAGGASCVEEGLYVSAGGWHDRMNRVRNAGAVSVCCALLRRADFAPFDEEFRGGLGMAEWCARQAAEGRLCAVTPHARAELEPDPMLLSGRERDPEDLRRFREKTGGKALRDPCYSPRFRRERADYRLP